MAYTALLSLSQVLEQALIHDDHKYPPHLNKRELLSLQQIVSTILSLFKDCPSTKTFDQFETQIIDKAYRAEDIIEYQLSSVYLFGSANIPRASKLFSSDLEVESGNLRKVLEKFNFILEELMKIKSENLSGNNLPLEPPDSAHLSTFTPSGTVTTVGLDDDFMELQNRMYSLSSKFEIIPIVGMGGIGKSTLARKLYDESARMSYFDRCAWISVSQEYSIRGILLRLLHSLAKQTDDQYKSVGELVVYVHKELFGRRYLIVVDDVWSTQAWDDLNRIFPKESSGSRVLLTTRDFHVATYVASPSSPPYEMHFLKENESWRLLEERVFGEGACPSPLEEIGKRIAKNCCGLPLTVVVVAGLLKGDSRKEYWESVSKNISPTQPRIALHCSKLFSLSYGHLPLHLKPCFLHLTAFPEDTELNANHLIRLWIAEGFVEPSGSQHLEEVAEGYLEDLAGRSLVLISEKRYNGRIKSVRVHDLLRDFGILKSQELRFHHGDLCTSKSQEEGYYHCDHPRSMKSVPRRLTINSNESLRSLRDIDCLTTRSLFNSSSLKRESIIDVPWLKSKLVESYTDINIPAYVPDFPLLRVLESSTATLMLNPEKSIHLRYISVKYERPS